MDDLTLVRDHTVYRCVMGSRAFGLATEASDTDLRGVYLAPTPLFWRFEKPPPTWRARGTRSSPGSWSASVNWPCGPTRTSWSACTPLVEEVTPVGEELLSLRGAFLSRRAHTSFSRYAASQRGKLLADVRVHGAPRWKHAMHLLRLLLSCRDLLRTGRLTIDAGPYRDRLLAVRRGELTWEAVDAWMARLQEETESALARTVLPAEPDHARVQDFLVRTRRASAV